MLDLRFLYARSGPARVSRRDSPDLVDSLSASVQRNERSHCLLYHRTVPLCPENPQYLSYFFLILALGTFQEGLLGFQVMLPLPK